MAKDFPPLSSVILININNDNHIGIANKLVKEQLEVLLLDTVGKIYILKTDTWMILPTPNIQTLRAHYHKFIPRKVNQVFIDKYQLFMNKYLLSKK